jgi:hypothetical protein
MGDERIDTVASPQDGRAVLILTVRLKPSVVFSQQVVKVTKGRPRHRRSITEPTPRLE